MGSLAELEIKFSRPEKVLIHIFALTLSQQKSQN